MRSVSDKVTLAGVAAALALRASNASAGGGSVDPTYGRIDGDIGIVVGAGGAIAPRGPRAEAELRLRYLETAGLFVAYEDAEIWGSSSEPRRVLLMGLELRPLFLFRWLQGHETRCAWFDLALDSIGLELGAVVQQPAGAEFASQLGLDVGLGIELPILERATGPWIGIRSALRWGEATLGSGVVRDADDRQVVVVVTLAWHQILTAHVVDWGDRAPR
jgi:hypothetical protein